MLHTIQQKAFGDSELYLWENHYIMLSPVRGASWLTKEGEECWSCIDSRVLSYQLTLPSSYSS